MKKMLFIKKMKKLRHYAGISIGALDASSLARNN